MQFNATKFCAQATKDVTYTVTVQSTDSAGNVSLATTTVNVPHNSEVGCITAPHTSCDLGTADY